MGFENGLGGENTNNADKRAQEKREAVFFSNCIINGVVNAHVHPLDKIKETYGMNDVQGEVVKALAYDEDGNPRDPEFRERVRSAIETLTHSEGINLSRLPSRAIMDLIYRQLDRD